MSLKASVLLGLAVLLFAAVEASTNRFFIPVGFFTDKNCRNPFGVTRRYLNNQCVTNAGTLATMVTCAGNHSKAEWTYTDYFSPGVVSSCANTPWKRVSGSSSCKPFPGKLWIQVDCGTAPKECSVAPVVDYGHVMEPCAMPSTHGSTCRVTCDYSESKEIKCDNGIWSAGECSAPFHGASEIIPEGPTKVKSAAAHLEPSNFRALFAALLCATVVVARAF
jgi:hypothetical protein